MKELLKIGIVVMVAILVTEAFIKPMLQKAGVLNFENAEEVETSIYE
jgi:hypothetical protein